MMQAALKLPRLVLVLFSLLLCVCVLSFLLVFNSEFRIQQSGIMMSFADFRPALSVTQHVAAADVIAEQKPHISYQKLCLLVGCIWLVFFFTGFMLLACWLLFVGCWQLFVCVCARLFSFDLLKQHIDFKRRYCPKGKGAL